MITRLDVQDYSAWLTPERLAAEEALWAEVGIYRLYAEHVMRAVGDHDCRSIIELGCGTGWVPTQLPPSIEYVGLDANPECVTLAQQKNPTRSFFLADMRAFRSPPFDLACSFAVLKHFALEEWAAVLGKVLSLGRVGLFTMNVGPYDLDDFEQGFAHTWVTHMTLSDAVYAAGHQLVSAELLHTGETMVCTCLR